MASGPITSWQIEWEIVETVTDFILEGSKITADGEYNNEIERRLLLGRKVMTNLDSILENRDKSYGFSSSLVWMWELDYKESWAQKNQCFWTVLVLEKTVESPLDSKDIQPVHPKGNQSRTFIGRSDAEAETSIHWPPNGKNWFIWKDLMLGKTEGRKRGWQRMRWLNGIIDWIDMSLSRLWELVLDREAWRAAVHEFAKSQTWLSNWTELNWSLLTFVSSLLRKTIG